MGLGDFVGDMGGFLIGANDLNAPNVNQDYINKILASANGLDPSMLTSSFQGISTDPAMRQAQMQALAQLSDISRSGGMDAQSRAALFQAENVANANEKAQREAALQNLAARGMGNSGAGISALLAAQQGGANREAMQGVQAAADARTRALAALGNMSNLAGNIRGQDWSEAAQKASALDAMKRAQFEGAVQKNEAIGKAYGAGMGFTDKERARKAADTAAMFKPAGDIWGGLMSYAGGPLGKQTSSGNPYDNSVKPASFMDDTGY